MALAPSPQRVAASTIDSTRTAASVIDGARRMTARLGDRSSEIETARRLPVDLLDELVAAGCFRILLPRTHGGVGATLVEALEMYEVLATADASTGWTVMIGSTGWCDLAGLPRPTFDELFAPSADVIVAGVFAPSGSITEIDGAYELTGRWAFASGCEHATYFFANAIEGFADGHPLMRASVLDVNEVTIEDTWDPIGLRGTGSHHVSVTGAMVPPERTFVPLEDVPCVDVPIVRIPTPAVFALGIAAVAIGTAQGALDDVVELAQEKLPLLAPTTLATHEQFQDGLARADARLGAGRSLLVGVARQLWASAETGASPSLEDRARARAAAAWATDAALDVTEFAYRAAGGGAVSRGSSLQRRLRDVHAITQHFLVRPDTFVAAGAILAGQGLSLPVF
jgi:alkylation response protein AidB-like acyl-CoA dehydrogenase